MDVLTEVDARHRRLADLASEVRYRGLFEHSPASLWEEDFSEVKAEIDRLRQAGVADFRAYFTGHPEFVGRCAELVRVLDVNEAALRLYEADTKAQLLGSLDRIFARESFAVFAGELAALAEGRRTFEAEAVNRTLGGSPIYISLRLSVAPGCEDTWSRVFISIVDITEGKQAEQALRLSEERLRMALDAADMVAWDWDTPTDTVYRSLNAGQVLGLGLEAVEGPVREFLELVHPEDRSRVGDELRAAQEGRAGYDTEFRLVRPDGSVRWMHDQGRVLRDLAGRPVRMTGVLRDVTAHRQAEEALRREEERYRDLFENANDIIYTLDLAGRITSLNKRAEQALGYSCEECLGRNAAEVVPPEYHARMQGALDRKLAGESEPTVYEMEVVRKDGRRVPLEVSSRLIVRDGRPVGIQGIARDITERKRAEAERLELLRRAQAARAEAEAAAAELAEADRRKDEFLATLAHELRNPLAPICNILHIMRMPGATEAQLEHVRGIMERQVQQLVRLVDDLLEVSRVMRGKIELRREALDLATVVSRAVETAQPLIDARKHELTVALPARPVRLEGDLVRLAQVLSNLLTNAAKYTEPEGRIWLAAERDGDGVVLRVKDTGIGIAPGVLPHVFELFVQAEEGGGRSQGGLGIGLTLVRRLVEMHGGTVAAASDGPGKGSEFVVRLPALPETRPAEAAADGETSAGWVTPRRVLVVDDNEDAAESLAVLLRLEGHEVRVAYDGPAALAVAAADPPEVVFLDLGMPGMSGYEVAGQLRREPALHRVRLVALTGWGQEEDRRRTEEAGFDLHLTKPADLDALRRLLAGGEQT